MADSQHPHGSHGHGRRYYLSDIPLAEARERFHAALEAAGAHRPMPAEVVPLAAARGRVTAEPVWAVASSPHYDAAAMDGIAVRAADTIGATETAPRSLRVGAAQGPNCPGSVGRHRRPHAARV